MGRAYRGYLLTQRAAGWDIRAEADGEVIDTAITLALACETIDNWLKAK